MFFLKLILLISRVKKKKIFFKTRWIFLGVSNVIVIVNKLDTINWSQERFQELYEILKNFLKKQAGFDNIEFVPLSGLSGINLIKRPKEGHPLNEWYNGPCLLEVLGIKNLKI